MATGTDLTLEALSAALPGRAVRSYPVLVSTGSAAHGWASEGAPGGAVVIADHQLAPRGHAGRPLDDTPGSGVGLSLVMRTILPAGQEGRLYTVALTGLADALGPGSAPRWPDEVIRGGAMAAAAAVRTCAREGQDAIEWALVDLLLPGASPPRGPLVREVVEAIEARAHEDVAQVLAEYDRRCETIGRRVRARFRAGTAPQVEGMAVETRANGALVLETAEGRRVAVRPQDVRTLEPV